MECRTITSAVVSPASSHFSGGPLERSAEHPARGFVLEQGQVFAKKYVLERTLGFGGMAQIWVATNQATGAEVCVKLLVPDPETGGHDEEAVERFRREAHAAAKLSHRGIVRVFDLLELDASGQAMRPNAGGAPSAYAIVMELLHGETLGEVLAKRGKLPLEEALDLFLPVASALGHAHRADVIHRDLKPDNIFLATEPDGHVIPKVLDFGVSKMVSASTITIDGVVIGTPCFMSPEQAKGARHIDARSDVFSAGILLYMMLSGRNPFDDAPTFAAVVDAVLRREVRPLDDVPPAIWAVIERAIAKDPAARFDTATELAISLRKASGRRASTESYPGIPLPAASSSRRGSTPSLPAATAATSRFSEPTAEPAASTSDAMRRRRAIAFVVLAAAVAVVLAASVVSLTGAREGTTEGSPSPPTSHTVSRAAIVEPPPAASAVVEMPSASPEVRAEPVKRAAAAPRASAAPGRGAASTASPATTSVRKPGAEPHKARDPGF